jgi:hypothetical protein
MVRECGLVKRWVGVEGLEESGKDVKVQKKEEGAGGDAEVKVDRKRVGSEKEEEEEGLRKRRKVEDGDAAQGDDVVEEEGIGKSFIYMRYSGWNLQGMSKLVELITFIEARTV